MITAKEAKDGTLSEQQIKENQKTHFLGQIEKGIRDKMKLGFFSHQLIMNTSGCAEIIPILEAEGFVVSSEPNAEDPDYTLVTIEWL